MTEAERNDEGAEEPIEDLEAPARGLEDVAGGAGCGHPSCAVDTMDCSVPTCEATQRYCREETDSRNVIVYER